MLIENFDEIQKLDKEIGRLLASMAGMDPADENYAKVADQLTKLIKIKEIIGNLKQKAFDAETKQSDSASSLRLKERELEHRVSEFLLGNEHKQKELEQRTQEHEDTHGHRTRELNVKQHESMNAAELKKREIDLKQQEFEKPDRVSKDALVAAAASIAGIVIIIGYERVNIIASKALGFVLRR